MNRILVTGANGQLGQCIMQVHEEMKKLDRKTCDIMFVDKKQLDITDFNAVDMLLSSNNFDYVINCAAYTDVNGAETNSLTAAHVNGKGAHSVALACAKNKVKLIHISTDYIFGNNDQIPFIEAETPNSVPLNAYGDSKLRGEQFISMVDDMSPEGLDFMVLRVSSLYSIYGKNFVKTILNKIHAQEDLSVVCDQVSSPTSAHELAAALYKVVSDNLFEKGFYNFSDNGVVSWYDFAKEIEYLYNEWLMHQCGYVFGYIGEIVPVYTDIEKRPQRLKMSVFKKEKFESLTGIHNKHWKIPLEYVVYTLTAELTKNF